MTPFDAGYWEDEYQAWLKYHDEITRKLELLIALFLFVIGFVIGKWG